MRLILRGALPLLLCVVLLVLFAANVQGVDCRKRPFAPKCRGVSAKRGIDVGREAERDEIYPPRLYDYDPNEYFWDERSGNPGYGPKISDDGSDHRVMPSPPNNKHNTDNTDQGRFLRALVKMYFDRRPELEV